MLNILHTFCISYVCMGLGFIIININNLEKTLCLSMLVEKLLSDYIITVVFVGAITIRLLYMVYVYSACISFD